ncbi:hypothetical protein A2U01_0067568, partial [Trifolium medium]|nr:hypothetical protein [Trifolium medium]
PNGVIKVNSDANLSREGRWGLGAVCCDSDGQLVAVATWDLPGFDDSTTAETCAVYLAADCCFKVLFESDNSRVISILNDSSTIP